MSALHCRGHRQATSFPLRIPICRREFPRRLADQFLAVPIEPTRGLPRIPLKEEKYFHRLYWLRPEHRCREPARTGLHARAARKGERRSFRLLQELAKRACRRAVLL